MEVEFTDTPDLISVFVVVDDKLASADLTKVGDGWFYFNRIFVPQDLRGRGIATAMMEKVAELLDARGSEAVIEVNPYGNLDFEQLVKFYEKWGAEMTEKGYMVRKPRKTPHEHLTFQEKWLT